MSLKWINKTIVDMKRSSDLAVRQTAKILKKNEDKLIFKANVLDPNGINRWSAPTRKKGNILTENPRSLTKKLNYISYIST
jgi:hypothetical protein